MNAAHPGTILVVDDHEVSRYARARLLRRAGYNVVEADSGTAALEMVRAVRPDLLILDVHLPDISGLEVCRRIKGEPSLAVIPVVHMSATNITAPDQVRGLEGGADGYLVEPIAPEVLIATVAAFLRARRAEAEAARAKTAMETLVRNLPGAAYRCAAPGRGLTFVSEGVLDLTGYSPSELLHANGWWHLIPEEDIQWMQALIQRAAHGPLDLVYRIIHREGDTRWIWDRVWPAQNLASGQESWEGFATDMTRGKLAQEVIARERERLEELVQAKSRQLERSQQQLRIAERFASLGTLCAGLGHDIGNLLLPMRTRLDHLEALGTSNEAQAEIAGLRASCDYFQRLVSGLRLLAMDSGPAQAGSATDLDAWWDKSVSMFHSCLPDHVHLHVSIAGGGLRAAISEAGLTQVVFNLVQNAGDALASRPEGSVTVSARPEGDQIVVEVVDDGPGMPAEVLRRCFEPFFTTRPRAVSTGLGLALVYGIVRDAHGDIQATSSPGAGTRFTIRLPSAGSAVDRGSDRARRVIELGLSDDRLRALITLEAKLLRCEVAELGQSLTPPLARIVDAGHACTSTAIPLLFVGPDQAAPLGATIVGQAPRIAELRAAMSEAVLRDEGGPRTNLLPD